MTDALLLLYPITGHPLVRGVYEQDKGDCIVSIGKSIFIWLGASEFIIGGYCLFAFILPFRHYIKLEREQGAQINNHRESLSSMAKRIVIFSSIMIFTTMICTIMAATFPNASGIILAD